MKRILIILISMFCLTSCEKNNNVKIDNNKLKIEDRYFARYHGLITINTDTLIITKLQNDKIKVYVSREEKATALTFERKRKIMEMKYNIQKSNFNSIAYDNNDNSISIYKSSDANEILLNYFYIAPYSGAIATYVLAK